MHRSPGLAMISEVARDYEVRAVLDLGPSSTESLQHISNWTEDLVIQDCFRSAGAGEGERSEAFQFESAEEVELPESRGTFDIVLVWDLLHYFDRRQAGIFASRLAELMAPGGMALVHASAIAPIPPTPIHFKIVGDDRLEYVMDSARVPTPNFNTRVVEQAMNKLLPQRVFQLRNGLQELIFQAPGEEAEIASDLGDDEDSD